LHKRYQRTERQLNKLDALQLHALRIQAKKLRYSAEFFAQLFDKQQARPYLDSLSDVQELLGEINDITVALRLLDDLAIHLPEHQEVVAFIKSMIDVNLTIKFKELNKRFKVFNELRVFWK
jgi:CHAD domain-containing protein